MSAVLKRIEVEASGLLDRLTPTPALPLGGGGGGAHGELPAQERPSPGQGEDRRGSSAAIHANSSPTVPWEDPEVLSIYRQLGGGELLSPEREVWVRLIASWLGGWGVLPDRLGLSEEAFAELNRTLLPCAALPEQPLKPSAPPTLEGAFEFDDLIELLLSGREGEGVESGWMATVVARGCLGADHLWQDLGLWSRADLSTLMNHHFPTVAARNDKDMKWKKFLYRQLCLQEEVLICKSPSCAACTDYQVCFGPEE